MRKSNGIETKVTALLCNPSSINTSMLSTGLWVTPSSSGLHVTERRPIIVGYVRQQCWASYFKNVILDITSYFHLKVISYTRSLGGLISQSYLTFMEKWHGTSSGSRDSPEGKCWGEVNEGTGVHGQSAWRCLSEKISSCFKWCEC